MALPYITSTEIPGKAVFQWDMPGPTLAKAQLLVALFFFPFETSQLRESLSWQILPTSETNWCQLEYNDKSLMTSII